MGQKTNSNIFRLGITPLEWKTRYIEKNPEESSLFIYKNLEIEKYLNRFFKIHGLLLHNYKLQYSNTTLNVFISYYKPKKSIFLIDEINSTQNMFFFFTKPQSKKKQNFKKISVRSKKINIDTNKFAELVLESLSIFTKKKLNIFLIFQNLNKSSFVNLKDFQLKLFKKIVIQLRQYSRNVFFKETINILFISINNKKSSKLLSEYISFQLSIMKRHNLFLIFLKRAFSLILKAKFSCIKGIKIVIKGRFNGASRARTRLIQTGIIPLQSLKSFINYYQTVSYTPNGTFGVKVWICDN